VLRGGAWSYYGFNSHYIRSAFRYWLDPSYTLNNIGFRCSISHP
jgi:formylglycine-generating enzyme required for sulfatase activity